MMKIPFTVKQANEGNILEVLRRTAALLKEESLTSGGGRDADLLILEDFGTTLQQDDWVDRTGWFLTYRLHPLYSRREDLKAAAQRLEARWVALFALFGGSKKTLRQEGDDGRITLVVETDVTSIGDLWTARCQWSSTVPTPTGPTGWMYLSGPIFTIHGKERSK